jgi:hypothetical protein
MNKLIIGSVGFPRIGDYWIVLQDAFKEALKGLSSAFGASYILSGCTITGTSTKACTEGFVVLNNEVYYVPVHTAAFTGSGTLCWVVNVVAVPNPKLYLDGSAHSLKEIRTANLLEVIGALGTDQYDVAAVPTVGKSITDIVKANPTAWRLVPANSTSEIDKFQTGVSSSGGLRYKKSVDNILLIEGNFNIVVTSGDISGYNKLLFTIPFAPTAYNIRVYIYSAGSILTGYIDTSGGVYLNCSSLVAGTYSTVEFFERALPL